MWHNEESRLLISPVRLALLLCLVSVAAGAVHAQVGGRVTMMPPPVDSDTPQQSSPLTDMMVKRRIRLEEKEHEENVGRAREVAQLVSELHNAYSNNHSLSSIEFKKLDRIEKLTKKIRDEFGGSNGDPISDRIPSDIESALERISNISDLLKARMEKTPRMVVSTTVIDSANELLDLIKIVKNFGPPRT